ncbi:MAG: HD-GYP domain-containing protein [Lachnospiraceae bacterium]|nr:HD-GYP domain-containing protein [Lachnospiraceae bacterium]
MDKIRLMKKIVKILAIAMAAILVILIIAFIGHVVKINNYNMLEREITSDSTTTEAMVDIHPRGGVTDSWEKENTGLGFKLNAKIYELVVTNNSQTLMDDWKLRINIHDDCYLNNGWCGKFEIHQFDEEKGEQVQTIDLRNYDVSEITINYTMGGQDLLIPLTEGDYIIYLPDGSGVAGEVPIKGSADFSGSVVCGIIIYNKLGSIDLSDYVFNYNLHLTYWEGSIGRFFTVSFPAWALLMIVLGVIFLMTVQFEERFIIQGKILEEVLGVTCSLADSKDYYSKEHSKRCANYSRLIAEKLGMDKNDCDTVYYAALLHNIGNYYVPEQILRKNGKLTTEEYNQVKTHTTKGAELLKELQHIPHADEAALYHHERYDGTGYPTGKKGEEIPLVARIVAVADAFDAMSIDRPYRKKFMREQIREEFIKNRGTQFDPTIVGVFLDIMGELDL